MLDAKLLRSDLNAVTTKLKRRGFEFNIELFNELEDKRKVIQVKTQELQNERNVRSKSIGQAKAQGQDIKPLLNEVASLGEKLKESEDELRVILKDIDLLSLGVPNTPHDSVPDGKTEDDNVVLRSWGDVPEFDFEPQEHFDLGVAKGFMDFEVAAKITGARFVTLSGPLARLQRALEQFMLDIHTMEHEYTETYVPFIVNKDSLYGTGQLPKFEEDLFRLNGDSGYYLIPTAEVPVTNLVRDVIIEEKDMPKKWVAHTPCFRSEAGTYGKDTRGMIRQHQFEKVELVQIVKPEDSYKALEELTSHAETILQKLKLPYQVLTLCAGDIGFSSAKTIDLEVWLPGQNTYREISSCSNFEDFQARRLQARWRNTETGKPELVHTVNGSGLAIGRTLVAVMENYQDDEGNILIPDALKPYMGGIEII